MAKNQKSRAKQAQSTSSAAKAQTRATGQSRRPVARWVEDGDRRLLMLENAHFSVALWPAFGGAVVRYIHRASGIDVIWRNPYGHPPRVGVLEQPMAGGSDLYDVMDGSWYVSLPNGFFAGDYFGAPLGTHGELRSLPWTVEHVERTAAAVRVELVGRSVRTPLVYRRVLTVEPGSVWLRWEETVENRCSEPLPIAWLQHPTFGGPLLDGVRLITPARSVRVFAADDPSALQLQAGYEGTWPFVPERDSGRLRDCSVLPPAGSGHDHSVQLADFEVGRGCLWNERLNLGFAMQWDAARFPYAWSWSSSGGIRHYPLWGEGHLLTLQPSTSPVGRFADLVRRGEVLDVPALGAVSTTMLTGFVTRAEGSWDGRGS